MSQGFGRVIVRFEDDKLSVGEILLLLRTVAAQLQNDPVMEHLCPALTDIVLQLSDLQKLAMEVADEDLAPRLKPYYLN